ncbi:hypothetical protein CLOM_g21422 [Closterium sp. NIES-68]|nr:hypothetical protein CLOM_g21422 [Closterium sp. NIES-68]
MEGEDERNVHPTETPESPPPSLQVLFQGVRVSPWHDIPLYPSDDEHPNLDPNLDPNPNLGSNPSSQPGSEPEIDSVKPFRMICTNPAGRHAMFVISPTDGQIVANGKIDSFTGSDSAAVESDEADDSRVLDFPWNCGVLPQTAAATSASSLSDADVFLPVDAVDISPTLHSIGDAYQVRPHAVIAIPNPLTLSISYRLVVSDVSAESAAFELDVSTLMAVLHRVCGWLEAIDTWLLSGHPDVAMQATVDPDEVAKVLDETHVAWAELYLLSQPLAPPTPSLSTVPDSTADTKPTPAPTLTPPSNLHQNRHSLPLLYSHPHPPALPLISPHSHPQPRPLPLGLAPHPPVHVPLQAYHHTRER